jgi:hypothetical protein
MTQAPIGQPPASTFEEVHRIKKLLARGNVLTVSIFEAVAARTIAFNLIVDGVRRGAVSFEDVADLLPGPIDEGAISND